MEKDKMSGVPEACSVTSTVDAQRDASTKSLVSCVAPFVEVSYRYHPNKHIFNAPVAVGW